MPRIMWKSFHPCFPHTKPSSNPSDPTSDNPNRTSLLLINSLFNDDSSAAQRRVPKPLIDDVVPSSTFTAANSSSSSTFYDESKNFAFSPFGDSPPPDLTTVFASRRFFFSSPGRSNSITDLQDLRCRDSYNTAKDTTKLLTGGTAVKHYVQSPDPYYDFRRSMQEMLDTVTNAGHLQRYEFLHELLLSYLSLNATDTHKFIIRAFADILVSLFSDGHHRLS